ncbi:MULTISPECIES: AAA family ATPase [Vagococcus]|uniref:Endonuclease GajA/Old nuclease/RecF-like AAA domain-containing protein n=1 Tax=Vagococcus fluvialis bH819 TaxID=1255619 RepID=A0A1X6WP70_9ENTE|nr:MULTISPECIES: AAA family ATPase [Vagococcus]SLM86131.1 hypothetical protein FM121_08585 [Vagococcus fluvialis bH819]HCM90380.1 hypothetical protein [Vagococcus sp.]
MKPIKFRIQNYKSIVDSGECYFEDGYTVLAGKNESGKTTILEALRDFDKNQEIDDIAIPLGREEVNTKISVWFEIDKLEIEDINAKFDYSLKKVNTKNLIKITKEINNEEYLYNCDFTAIEHEKIENYWKKNINPFIIEFKEEIGMTSYLTYLINGDVKKKIEYLNRILDEEEIFTIEREIVEISVEEDEILSKMKKTLELYKESMDVTDLLVKKLINCYMPNFVFYSSFNDTFPDVIRVEDIKNSEFAQDLEKISKFDIDAIIDKNKQTQSNHQRSVNTEFTDIFKKYWTQDNIKLVVEKDGENVHFWIEENSMMFKPSQRSQGQQWFLSFYIKVVARMKENNPNVILIDEPGLFLHAKAQKNMLKTLEEQFKENLILFSTHSPYLIEENKINQIRLIEKENNETVIHSKTWAKIKDTETLTPILTAIGLGLGDGITDRGRNNIICEGVEDVFYLRAFKKIIDSKLDINFINGDGAAKLQFIGRILEAWQCSVMYILDNDKAGHQAKKKLVKKEFVEAKDIIMVTDKENSSTVDLLSIEDFKKYILEESLDIEVIKNSDYISSKKLEKALLARKFLMESSKIKLNQESMNNIENLFKKIDVVLKSL